MGDRRSSIRMSESNRSEKSPLMSHRSITPLPSSAFQSPVRQQPPQQKRPAGTTPSKQPVKRRAPRDNEPAFGSPSGDPLSFNDMILKGFQITRGFVEDMDKAYQEIPATFESIDTILTQILKTIVGSSSDEFMFKYAEDEKTIVGMINEAMIKFKEKVDDFDIDQIMQDMKVLEAHLDSVKLGDADAANDE